MLSIHFYHYKLLQFNKLNYEILFLYKLKLVSSFTIFYCDIFYCDIFYCYKCYDEEPKNEEDIKLFCDYDNLHRSIHSNDLNKRIKLEYGTEKAKIELLKYLKGKL